MSRKRQTNGVPLVQGDTLGTCLIRHLLIATECRPSSCLLSFFIQDNRCRSDHNSCIYVVISLLSSKIANPINLFLGPSFSTLLYVSHLLNRVENTKWWKEQKFYINKPTRCTFYVFILQSLYNSTCFERVFRSSSGVHDLLYLQLCTNHANVSNRLVLRSQNLQKCGTYLCDLS